MLIMETKNKLNYEVTNEEAYVYEFLLYVDFIYQDKKYNARANYTMMAGEWIMLKFMIARIIISMMILLLKLQTMPYII
jgi:hypothetical protein